MRTARGEKVVAGQESGGSQRIAFDEVGGNLLFWVDRSKFEIFNFTL